VATKRNRRTTFIGALALAVFGSAWALPTTAATAADPTPIPIVLTPTVYVTIGFDDGTADQFAARRPLLNHGMHATFLRR
jgi:hypothetical protein